MEPPLCRVGSSIIELVHLHSTGAGTRVDPALVSSSLVFVAECPESVIPTFREVTGSGFDPDLRDVWIEAVRSAAGDSSNTVVRGLLAVARERVAHLGDRSLDEFLDGIFEGSAEGGGMDRRALESLFERQAAATLGLYSECDGVGCFIASDNVLFLLGTHPVALFKAMRDDPEAARRWLYLVEDESFSGLPEDHEIYEAARRIVLRKLSETEAPGYERERRACEDTLRRIRFREWD